MRERAEVARLATPSPRLYLAVCRDCSWSGPSWTKRSLADEDRAQHDRARHGSPLAIYGPGDLS